MVVLVLFLHRQNFEENSTGVVFIMNGLPEARASWLMGLSLEREQAALPDTRPPLSSPALWQLQGSGPPLMHFPGQRVFCLSAEPRASFCQHRTPEEPGCFVPNGMRASSMNLSGGDQRRPARIPV